MSDPVTNADIEDVLSSIRRLVSENATPQAQPKTSAAQATTAPPLRAEQPAQGQADPVEKLVLTPAFRVHEGAAQPSQADEATPELVEAEGAHQSSEDITSGIAAQIAAEAEVEATQHVQADMSQDERQDQAVEGEPNGVMFLHRPINRPQIERDDRPEQQDASEDEAQIEHTADTVSEDVMMQDPDQGEGPHPESIEATEASWEAPVDPVQEGNSAQTVSDHSQEQPGVTQIEQALQQDVAQDLSDEGATTVAGDLTENDVLNDAPAEGQDAVQVDIDVQVADAEAFDWPPIAEPMAMDDKAEDRAQADNDPALEHRVAELEAAVNDSAVEFEPDCGDQVEDLGPGIFLRHRAEKDASVTAPEQEENTQSWDEFDAEVAAFIDEDKEIEGHAERLEGAASDQATLDDEDADLIDEEMLRELVVRLVREELQGAVGEKITRNVRRLVRREVERALTLKSLE